MTKKNTEKTRARELQELSGGTASYAACLSLLRELGEDGARVELRKRAANGERS